MKVAVTCIQLVRDLEAYRPQLEQAGFELAVPEIAGQHLEGAELVAAMSSCVGVVAGDDRFTADVLAHCPDLRVISKWGSGVDGIDQAAAAAKGIVVTNTPGMFDDEVGDVTMAYITMLARSLHVIDRGVHAGRWPKPAGTSLRGSTLGIIGLGGIGRAVARRALTAGMVVVGSDPSPVSAASAAELGVEIVELPSLLSSSRFVSVNCPLTPATHHLIDDAALATMRPGAYLVNTGRGGVVSTEALVDALDRGHLAGAALDVMEDEPPRPDGRLLRLEQVVFGSHNGSNTLEASARVHRLAIANLARELSVTLREEVKQ